jgi:hypothetical protein
VAFTHRVGDGLHSASIKATRPGDATAAAVAGPSAARLPVVDPTGCC